jgi:HEPN superfamily AbiU2-like protein
LHCNHRRSAAKPLTRDEARRNSGQRGEAAGAVEQARRKQGCITVEQTEFEKELEIFRTEEETAQQYFFSYLSIRDLAGKNDDVLNVINTTPLFWVTVHHAMLLSAFVALGRIFDQNSRHNIDRLISVASKNLSFFSKAALQARKQSDGLTQQQAANYVADAHQLTVLDLRTLRKEIARWRGIYQKHYRDVRDKVFAHKALSNLTQINELLAKTNIDQMKRLFAFLNALYSALWEQFHNGRQPLLHVIDFVLPPDPIPRRERLPGETIYREGHTVLMSMLPGQS